MLARSRRLVDIQAQQVEVGRIRLGTSQAKQGRRGPYNEPVKLSRFRLTSRSEQLIRQAAQAYGGEVKQWTPQTGGAAQWEVIIDSTSIAVIVPPDACSQYYEQWSGGKCSRRCDGATELLTMRQCPCGPEPAAKKAAGCKPTTRLALMLADLPGIGVWRLETHGFYAASELPAVADLLSAAGGNVPARLELEERSAQVPHPREPDKLVTARYMVPVLHVEVTPAAIVGTFGGAALKSGAKSALPGAPEPVRAQAQIGHQQTAAIGATPAQEDQEVMKKQWTVHTWFVDRIQQADGQKLTQLADQIRNEQRLLPQFRDDLLGIVAARVDSLAAAAAQADTPPDPWGESTAPAQPAAWSAVDGEEGVVYEETPAVPATQTAPAEEAPQLNRDEAWQQINLFAGGKGITSSRLREMYKSWTQGGDLAQATAAQLRAYLGWLERQA